MTTTDLAFRADEVAPQVPAEPTITDRAVAAIHGPRKARVKPKSTAKPRTPAQTAALARAREASARARSAAKAKPPAKRETVAGDLELAWSVIGAQVTRLGGTAVPAGRAMVFQAPCAGAALDGVLAGTWADRKLVQPVAAKREAWKAVTQLVELPVLVAIGASGPGGWALVEHRLRGVVRETMATLADRVEEDAKHEAEIEKRLSRLEKDGITVDSVLAALVGGLEASPPAADG